jgi:hypothetical protein
MHSGEAFSVEVVVKISESNLHAEKFVTSKC